VLKEWTALAEFIASLTDPPVDVPAKLGILLDATISLRQSYSGDVTELLEDSAGKRASDNRHTFFLNVLRKVRDTLAPRFPRGGASTKKPKTMQEIYNIFENLDLEEPSTAFQQMPEVKPATPTPEKEPIYKAERQNDPEENFFALHLLLHDFNTLRTEVSRAWSGYKSGVHDLFAAAIATNTAVDLARSMTDDLKSTFAKHGGEYRMLQVYFAAQCIAAGTSVAHKAQPGDDMNFSQYILADVMFVPAA
jgi:hypothetical protein